MKKRFTLPKPKAGRSAYNCKSFVMRELIGKDQHEAAMMADMRKRAVPDTAFAQAQLERDEAMRLSVVEVDGRPTNIDGVPFIEMDNYNYQTLYLMRLAFNEMNGVGDEEAETFINGAEIVGPVPSVDQGPAKPQSISALKTNS